MATEKRVDYSITADPANFEAGMKKAVDTAKAAQASIEGDFSKVADVLKGTFGQLAVLFTALGAGVAFKGAIEETKKLTGEANLLARTLGVSATEASILNVALGDIYTDAETLASAAQKLDRTLRQDEEALRAMGIETRTASGELRGQMDILQSAIDVVNDHKVGIDRNLAAQTAFGRGADELSGLLKLNAGVIEEARKKADSLNLTLSAEGVAATKRYKGVLNDLGDVMSGMKKTVGEALMPVLSDLGEWFAESGPQKVSVLKVAVESIVVVLRGLEFVVYTVWRTIKAGFENIATAATGLAKVLYHVLKGEYSEALAVGKATAIQFKDNTVQAFTDIGNKAVEVNEKITKMMAPRTAAKSPADAGGRAYVDPKGKESKDPSILASLEEKLALERDAYERSEQQKGTLREFSKAQELAFWQQIVQTTKLGETDKLSVTRKILALQHDIRKQGFDEQIAGQRAELEEFRNDSQRRIEILSGIHKQLATMYGEDSKQAREALGEIAKERRKMAEQSLAIARLEEQGKRQLRLMDMDDAERQLQFEADMGQRSRLAQLDGVMAIELERRRIRLETIQAERALLEKNAGENREAIQRNKMAEEELEKQHLMRMEQLRRESVREQSRFATEAMADIQAGLQSAIAATLKGTQSIGGMFKAMFASVLDALANMLAKMAAQWLMEQVREKLFGAVTALSKIKDHAAVAGAAAYASTAAIPVVGPVLAPGAAAQAFAGAMSFGAAIPFAARGYDIPAGINPLTQLHQKEMVLPAEHAETIRGMAGKGGGGDTWHIHAVDARSFMDLIEANGGQLVRVLERAKRMGA
jgi:hypothetical protein